MIGIWERIYDRVVAVQFILLNFIAKLKGRQADDDLYTQIK